MLEPDPNRLPHARLRHVTALAAFGLILVIAGSAAALEAGGEAPEIGLRDTRGELLRMSDLRGKVVIVDFWASWCEPCREEIPVLNELQRRYRDRLVVVGVNIDRDEDNMRRFLRRTRARFRIVHDPQHQVADRFEPEAMPSSYFIDREGVVRYVHRGFHAGDRDEFVRQVERLIE